MSNPDPLWLKGTPGVPGICDRILAALVYWIRIYHDKGIISATCKQNQMMGKEMKVVDVITRRACKIPWRQSDLDYFIKILEAKWPKEIITKDLRRNFPLWANGMPTTNGSGARIIELDWYFEHIVSAYQLLEAMRDGREQKKKQDLASVDLEKISG